MGGWRGVATAALAGLLVACAGSAAEPDASPTIPVATPSPTPTPTPTPEDPYAIPDEIDEDYLNRVFEALERVIGDATRLIVAQKTYPPEADDLHMAVFTGTALQTVRDGWIETLIVDPDLEGYLPAPTDRVTRVSQVFDATPECVFVEVVTQYEGVHSFEAPTDTVYIVLLPAGVNDHNFTPWAIERQAQLVEDRELPEVSLCSDYV